MADLISMLAAASGIGAEEADPNFNQTVLLLHGDGTNGAQNNTFLDSSTNNFTITRNGNTTQGTFSPFSLAAGEWSNYFDGSGDNLATSATLGSGDFTLEFWFYPLSVASGLQLTGSYSSLSTGHWIMFGAAGNKITLYNGPALEMTLNINAWNHICWVRSSGTSTWYHNGVSVSSAADTTNWTGTGTLYIGGGGTANNTNGYISNYRLVKGVAIVPPSGGPTSPLTAVSGTDYLTCQSNRFVDNSSSPKTITRNGDVRVTPFSPFAPTAAYSAGTNGGSGYFDGTGDYLSIADAAGLRFGTGNFTIQCWIYRNAASAVHSIAAKGGASTGWVFQVHSDNKLRFTHTTTNIDSTGTIPASAWTHVAVVREGTGTNQVKLYINGVNDGQGTVSTDFNQTEQLNIGADRGNSNVMNGYIAGWKYVVGTAETITVPTAPPTGGTALLNFTNAGIIDNTGKNNLETVGNAQIDTTTKKFGTGSLEFDGTGDYLIVPNSTEFDFGSGNFTLEFWINFNSLSGAIGIIGKRAAEGNFSPFLIEVSSSTLKLYISTSGSSWAVSGLSTSTLSTGTWYHIAATRSGTTVYLFLNGTSVGSTGTATGALMTNTTPVTIGQGATSLINSVALNGYIDDLRITKGVARYTANFVPPTAAFPNE